MFKNLSTWFMNDPLPKVIRFMSAEFIRDTAWQTVLDIEDSENWITGRRTFSKKYVVVMIWCYTKNVGNYFGKTFFHETNFSTQTGKWLALKSIFMRFWESRVQFIHSINQLYNFIEFIIIRFIWSILINPFGKAIRPYKIQIIAVCLYVPTFEFIRLCTVLRPL